MAAWTVLLAIALLVIAVHMVAPIAMPWAIGAALVLLLAAVFVLIQK